MAYNKRTWVNDETELSAENFQYIEDGIYNNQNIEIIAISEDEPEEYEVGDKYYNSLHKLIYTANENDWGVGETPIRGAFYLLLSEQSSYYFDGSDMISVGGGTEDILIQDEEPLTDDWKLWIDTGEINGSFSEVVDSLEGNETTKAPSVRAVNGIVESGTNNYGNYTKFSDGTMICYREFEKTGININLSWGSLYIFNDTTEYNFAQEFIAPPTVTVNYYATTNIGAMIGSYENVEITKNYFKGYCLIRPTSSTNARGKISIIAIGRWK